MRKTSEVYEGFVLGVLAMSDDLKGLGALQIPFYKFWGKSVRVTVEVLGE